MVDEGVPSFVEDMRTIFDTGHAIVPKVAATWRPSVAGREAIVDWARKALEAARDVDEVLSGLEDALTHFEQTDDVARKAGDLLRAETRAVAQHSAAVDASDAAQNGGAGGTGSGRGALDQKSANRRVMSLAKTLLDSILAILGDLISPSVKAMLQVVKEAYEAFA